MNRHRAYWSAMGVEPNNERSHQSIADEKIRNELNKMVCRFGFWEVVRILKKIKEEEE